MTERYDWEHQQEISGPIVDFLREAMRGDCDVFTAEVLAYEAARALLMRMMKLGGSDGWPADPWPAVWAAAESLADESDGIIANRQPVCRALRRLVGWRPT